MKNFEISKLWNCENFEFELTSFHSIFYEILLQKNSTELTRWLSESTRACSTRWIPSSTSCTRTCARRSTSGPGPSADWPADTADRRCPWPRRRRRRPNAPTAPVRSISAFRRCCRDSSTASHANGGKGNSFNK